MNSSVDMTLEATRYGGHGHDSRTQVLLTKGGGNVIRRTQRTIIHSMSVAGMSLCTIFNLEHVTTKPRMVEGNWEGGRYPYTSVATR